MNKYEEALKRLNGMIYTSPFSDEKSEIDYNDLKKCDTQLQNNYLENINTLQELVANHEKYSWHDLRKNPEDLPEGGYIIVFVCLQNKYGFKGYSSAKYNTYSNAWQFPGELDYMKKVDYEDKLECNIVAWRYIEPFEELENE